MADSRFEYLLHEPLRSGENRLSCPACSADRKSFNQSVRTLSVRDWGDRITYHCWHCGEKDAIPRRKDIFQSPRKSIITPPPQKESPLFVDETDDLNRDCYDWLEQRGISRETADEIGIRRGKIRGTDAIALPYSDKKGKVAGYKLRSLTIPKREGGFSIIGKVHGLFMADRFDPALGYIIICEGEFDAAACLEAGIKNAVSIPHGAIPPGANPDSTKLAFLSESEALFRGLKRVVIATDNDPNGKATGDEIARRIGHYRVYRPVWPGKCKDANDVLMDYGADRLQDVIKQAKADEIPGLTKPSAFRNDLMRFRRGEVLQGFSTGYTCIDPIFRITPGVFTTITGHPGHGKSEFVDQMHVNMALREDWNFAIWSRENPGFIHVAKLIEKFQRKRFHPDMNNVMSDREVAEGEAFVEKHATYITSDGGPDTMESILERLTGAVMRDGIKSAVIDPYNYVHKNAEIAREDLQISDMLTLGTDWCKNHECHIFFVAHPKTMDEEKVPNGYSISGGGTFNAKTDFGLTVHRPDKGRFAQLYNWKTRHSWLGKVGCADLGYSIDEASYYDLNAPYEDPIKTRGIERRRDAEVVELEVVNGGRDRYQKDDDYDREL